MGGGGVVVSRFMILSRFFVMLVFLFCKWFEYYSQTNVCIYITVRVGLGLW